MSFLQLTKIEHTDWIVHGLRLVDEGIGSWRESCTVCMQCHKLIHICGDQEISWACKGCWVAIFLLRWTKIEYTVWVLCGFRLFEEGIGLWREGCTVYMWWRSLIHMRGAADMQFATPDLISNILIPVIL